ncbi:beta-lactamase/transpeptidase-like protein [Boeremia exigua]|uniref:beta-lactamase/transpeptidase-like protein n=1 Tax=Boeremia exigua TaxID=749465 RepID=UPI001E8DA029|nr:beta-lactamase/transpeptidase-like protein [Boeremia exigua]KAH6639266.1 beta-lactamase/transpeptidase-like protein [Boeremia exigua]
MHSRSLFFYSSLVVTAVGKICPILGPAFPSAKNLHSSDIFQDALKSIQNTINTAISSGNSKYGQLDPNNTHSVQIFSIASEQPLLDYHRRGLKVLGNRTIDGDSVYRVGSISKLLTVYLLLLEVGETIFNEKVTKYLPELKGVAHWNDITIGSLAGYVGGITAEFYDNSKLPGGDISAAYPNAYPPLAANETTGCVFGGASGCSRAVFIQNLIDRRPAYLPHTTPAYTNAAFAALGLILESITNSTYEDALHNLLGAPLHLNGTTSITPSPVNAVIPGNSSSWDWDISGGAGAGMGGLYSSPNDLSTIGRAILSSSLLPGSTTRAWLKPTSFTSSLIGGVGRPWEIYRAVINPQPNRIVDMYTKGGDVPGYGAILVLIPDFDVGFTVMTASSTRSSYAAMTALIGDELLPALEEAARAQADSLFAGTYTAANGLNSTVKLTTTPGVPGLSIETWISNGTDLRLVLSGDSEAEYQLYPTNIASEDGKELSWRAVYLSQPETGSPYDACPSWFGVDRPSYGIWGLDEMVFHLGEDGKARGMELRAQKIVLERV